MYQIITLFALNLHNIICQLCLNKAGVGKRLSSDENKLSQKPCLVLWAARVCLVGALPVPGLAQLKGPLGQKILERAHRSSLSLDVQILCGEDPWLGGGDAQLCHI